MRLRSGVVIAPAPASANTVRDLQWYLGALGIPQAHKVSNGRGVTVAVIDNGVNAAHPDLRGQVLPGHGIGPDAAPDGRRSDDPERDHGTSMASLIAGRGDGEMSLLGIAPEARILPISLGRVIDEDESAEAIRWAVENADVINMSFVRDVAPSEAEREAIAYALEKDVVLVAGAGNRDQGHSVVMSPANVPGVIAVSGTRRDGRAHPGSAQGPEVVLAAPMEEIIGAVSVSPNGYGVATGTSDATALVSGVAALVRSRFPDLGAADVINRLIVTADDRGPSGRDDEYGFGAVDPVAALRASVDPVDRNPLLAGDPESEQGGAADRPRDGDSGDGDSWVPEIAFKAPDNPAAFLQMVLCLGVPVVAVIVGLVMLVRSRRGKRRGGAPPAYGLPPAYGPPPAPGGYAQPPGYPPTPAYPQAPGRPGPVGPETAEGANRMP